MCISVFPSSPINWNLTLSQFVGRGHDPADPLQVSDRLVERKRVVHTVGRGLAPAETYRFWIFGLNGSRSKPEPSGGGEPPPYGTPRQTPICRTLGNASKHISKSSPEGIPHLISHISYLISAYPAPSATGDRGCDPRTKNSPRGRFAAAGRFFSWVRRTGAVCSACRPCRTPGSPRRTARSGRTRRGSRFAASRRRRSPSRRRPDG